MKKADKIVRDRLLVENFIAQKIMGRKHIVEGLAESFNISVNHAYKIVRDHRKANPEAFEIKAEVPVEKPITESMGAMDALIESQLKNPQRLNISNAITEEPSTRKWWRRLKSFWSDN